MTTDCTCERPGWCQRHQCVKTEHWHTLCRTRAGYFRLWEQGRGPGQGAVRQPQLVAPLPCRHLGESVRKEACRACRGHVQVKVFACALHGECTLGRMLQGTACCARCPDYSNDQAPETAEGPARWRQPPATTDGGEP